MSVPVVVAPAPNPLTVEELADWLHARLAGESIPVRLCSLIVEAGHKGFLPPGDDGRFVATELYRARHAVERRHPGSFIWSGRLPDWRGVERACWELRRVTTPPISYRNPPWGEE
jgi:hypothetical protein